MSLYTGTPSAPKQVKRYPKENNSVTVSWQRPSYAGGVDDVYYKITVAHQPRPGTGLCNICNANFTTNETSITLIDLKCMSYNITIQPLNCVGIGSPINISITSGNIIIIYAVSMQITVWQITVVVCNCIIIIGVPEKVTNLSAVVRPENKSVLLQWGPPLHTGDENILYYKIMHIVTTKNEMNNVPWNITGTTATLNTSTYRGYNSFSVQAVNCNGEGHPAYIKISLPNNIPTPFGAYVGVSVAVAVVVCILFITAIFSLYYKVSQL